MLGQSTLLSVDEELALLFSIKESVFKALHPLLRRQIDWKEVRVLILSNGHADVTFQLKQGQEQEQGQGQGQQEGDLALLCRVQYMRYYDQQQDGSTAAYWITFAHIFTNLRPGTQ